MGMRSQMEHSSEFKQTRVVLDESGWRKVETTIRIIGYKGVPGEPH